MLPDICERHRTLAELQSRPPALDAKSCTLRDDLIDKEFLLTLFFTVHTKTNCLLELSDGCDLIKQRLEETQKLLLFLVVDRSVVVEDREENRHDQGLMLTFKHQQIVVFIVEHHLVHCTVLMSVTQGLLNFNFAESAVPLLQDFKLQVVVLWLSHC